MKKHALVVGGSGMLARASLWLANHGYIVSIIGRNRKKLNKLAGMSEHVIPISVNYLDEDKFSSEIQKSINQHGPYELVIAWIHCNEKKVIDIISKHIRSVTHKWWNLFHVLGSSSNLDEILRTMDDIDFCNYHQVQLGFIIENTHSRWLTHDEIANGVIHAINTMSKKHVVGTLTPWHKRP